MPDDQQEVVNISDEVTPSTPSLHVALLLLAPFASGAEHQTLALCRYLRPHCRVTLLTNDEFSNLLNSDTFLCHYTAGLEVVSIGPAFPAAPLSSLRGAFRRVTLYPRLQWRAWQVLRRSRPQIVHLLLAPSFFAYAPLFHLLAIPTVLTLAGEMRYVRHFYGAVKRLAVSYAMRQARALVVCSADELENLRQVVPAAVGKATVLDNFTDVARFAPSEKDAHLVTFAARLHPEKGALLFLDAAALVHRTHPQAHFALYGRGEQAEAVEQRIAELGLQEVVTRGFTTDLAPLFARSSIFVSCQQHENLGSSSLLEAMASANAIVATDVGQTRQIVDDEVGRRVPPDPATLTDAIISLLDNPARTEQLGQQARARVQQQYGPEHYVRQLLEIYSDVKDT